MSGPLAVALAGTAQHPGVMPTTGTDLDQAIAAQAAESPERALLLAAGVNAVARLAGRLPDSAPPLPRSSDADPLPILTAGVAEIMRALLAGECPPQVAGLVPDSVVPGEPLPLGIDRATIQAILSETLGWIAEAGYRLPPDLLPAALDLKEERIRAALLPVLGERGRWLAGQNPAWSWVRELEAAGTERELSPEVEQRWQEGTPAERLAALTQIRRIDPEQGRNLLAETWKGEKAETRLTLLGALATRLSLADEPFLEAVLGERAERVRARAAELLAPLSGSGLAARMRARALGVLTAPTHHPGGRPILVATLPEELPPDWQRDGILAKPTGLPREPRAWWLSQVVAVVPPAVWVEHLRAEAEDCVAAAQASEWDTALRLGWARAAIAHTDPDWLQALWQAWPQDDQVRSDLLRAMPPEVAEENVLAYLRYYVTYPGRDEPAALRGLPQPWSAQFSQDSLPLLRRIGTERIERLFRLLAVAGPALHPDQFTQALVPWHLPELEGDPPDPTNYAAFMIYRQGRQALGQFLTVIALRILLRRTLRADGAIP